MPVKDIHSERFDEGTITKLEIFESYFESWLPVFLNKREINVFDFFAGSGTDAIGIHGSPLRILKVIKKFKNKIFENKLKINLFFNEFDENKYADLEKIVNDQLDDFGEIKDFINLNIINKDFRLFFDQIKNDISDKINLLFFDQNGVKHITKDVLLDLDGFSKTDYLFFISSSYIFRFRYKFEKYFPEFDWTGIKSGDFSCVHRKILEYYKSLLPENSRTRLYPFSIKKRKGIYGLIFGSKHPLGVDKFLRIAWGRNALNGEADFDIDRDDLKKQLELFDDKPLTKVEAFEQDLENFILSKDSITNKEVYDFTLESGFISKHAVVVMKRLKKNKRINFTRSPKINYVNCYGRNKEILTYNVEVRN